jgi:hypothetical protein
MTEQISQASNPKPLKTWKSPELRILDVINSEKKFFEFELGNNRNYGPS